MGCSLSLLSFPDRVVMYNSEFLRIVVVGLLMGTQWLRRTVLACLPCLPCPVAVFLLLSSPLLMVRACLLCSFNYLIVVASPMEPIYPVPFEAIGVVDFNTVPIVKGQEYEITAVSADGTRWQTLAPGLLSLLRRCLI